MIDISATNLFQNSNQYNVYTKQNIVTLIVKVLYKHCNSKNITFYVNIVLMQILKKACSRNIIQYIGYALWFLLYYEDKVSNANDIYH